MKAKDLYRIIDEEIQPKCRAIMESKGEAYSGIEDKLGNFKRVAKSLCMTVPEVWSVYFHKHIDSLDAWVRKEYNDSEPILGRLLDLRNYIDLLYCWIKEQEETK